METEWGAKKGQQVTGTEIHLSLTAGSSASCQKLHHLNIPHKSNQTQAFREAAEHKDISETLMGSQYGFKNMPQL